MYAAGVSGVTVTNRVHWMHLDHPSASVKCERRSQRIVSFYLVLDLCIKLRYHQWPMHPDSSIVKIVDLIDKSYGF